MRGANIGIFETMRKTIPEVGDIKNEIFTRPGDNDPTDLTKADEALIFIETHVGAGHPVIVSTWNWSFVGERVKVFGYHMWLLLSFDRSANCAVYHDSGSDRIQNTLISNPKCISLSGVTYTIDDGLRGKITHSDYTCLALWREAT